MRQRSFDRFTWACALGAAFGLAGAERAGADEGRIEINQAAALAGDVTAGDTAGFPVTLSAPGSYVLTSNLDVPDADTDGIEVLADHTTLDLNGFSVLGPSVCSGEPPSCAPTGTGVGVASSAAHVTVMNGSVIGLGGLGLDLGTHGHVKGVAAISNGGGGIRVGDRSHVIESRANTNGGDGIEAGLRSLASDNSATGNAGFGLRLGDASAFATNLLSANNSGDSNAQLASAGVPVVLDPSSCGTMVCTECGNTTCDASEDCASCPADCGPCMSVIRVTTVGVNAPGCGSDLSPCATIAFAIQEASGFIPESDVTVGEGIFAGSFSMLENVDVIGGFDPSWTTPGAFLTQIVGTSISGRFAAVEADAITQATSLSYVTVLAPNGGPPGSSSYGVWVDDAPGFQLANATVVAGNGADGLDGAAGPNGATGENGQQGFNGQCTGGGQGGNGAASSCGVQGGDGGDGSTSGSSGLPGSGPGGNPGGPGLPGFSGSSGPHGGAGSGPGSGGLISGGDWISTAGSDGGSAGPGGGGGGGGGGATGSSGGLCFGGGGGGGGAGGCEGASGGGGTGGGGSFAVFVLTASGLIDNAQLTAATGGSGGAGAPGGNGAFGGNGGLRGIGGDPPLLSPADNGGNGGSGGKGGNGGDGFGGAGGPSYGLFLAGGASVTLGSINYTVGTGGTGGAPGGGTGAAGDKNF
jgi:hypothetical protein